MIEIIDIKTRLSNLNESYNPTYLNVQYVMDNILDTRKLTMENAMLCLNNWRGLSGQNTNMAFTQLVEMSDIALENLTESQYNKIINIISENVIPRVRDGVETQNYIKHKLSRFKTKLSTKINNNVSSTKDAVKDSIDAAKQNLSKNVDTIKTNVKTGLGVDNKDQSSEEEHKNEVKKEAYEKLYEKAEQIHVIDRILENYNKISKRFNIDRLIVNAVDARDGIVELCKLIETYNIPFKSRFNIALESSLYGFEKNHIPYSKSEILNTVTDFYLMREDHSIGKIKDVLDQSLIFSDEDKKDLQYITELDPEADNQTTIDSGFIDNYGINEIDNLLEAKGETKETAKKLINDFKSLPNKTVEGLKSLIKRLYAKTPDQIVSQCPNILSWIRIAFIDGTAFAINPILGVITLIADQAISLSIKRSETEKMIKSYKAERDKAKKKLENVTSNEAKERYKKLVDSLDKDIKKLETYFNNLHTDEENMNRTSDDDTSFGDDDFGDFSFDEAVSNLAAIMNSLEESTKILSDIEIDSLLSAIDKNINKMNMDNIDLACEFFSIIGSSSDKSKLINSLHEHRKIVRKNPGYSSKYIMIECLTNNIEKLNSVNEAKLSSKDRNELKDSSFGIPSKRKFPLNDEAHVLAAIRMFNHADKKDQTELANNIKKKIKYFKMQDKVSVGKDNDFYKYYNEMVSLPYSIVESFEIASLLSEAFESMNTMMSIYESNSSILEASFTNTLALASEKLKKAIVKLSDTDKKISKDIDVSVNNMKKAAERVVTNDNREAVIKGSIIPSASKILKMALTAGAAAVFIHPAIAAIGVLGYLGASSKMKAKERQMILDEIEIEMNMVDRYLKIAEEKDDLKAQRQLLTTKRALERQHQRIKYKMKVEFGQETATKPEGTDDED